MASRSVAEGTFVQRLRTISEQREFRFQRKDGTHFWALMGGSAIRNEQGEVSGALGMITDITALKRSEDALRRSEAEFRVVFENAAIGMALLDGEGRITRSNPALQRFLDFSEAELHLVPFDSLVHPEDRDLDGDIVRDVVHGQRSSHQSERRYVRKDGAVVWGRLCTSVVQPTNGIPLSVIGMIENITDRRRAEDAVRSSERLRALMYGAVSDVLFYISVEAPNRYRFLSVNPAFLKATGLSEAAVIGRTLGEVIPASSLGQVLANYGRAIQERQDDHLGRDHALPRRQEVRRGDDHADLRRLGNCTNLVGTVHDVTERRIAEQRLADQAALLDRARDAIMVRDLDGVIRYWNEGAQRLYGWSSAEAVGRRVPDFLYRRPAPFEEAQRRLLESGAWSGEIEQVTKAGKNVDRRGQLDPDHRRGETAALGAGHQHRHHGTQEPGGADVPCAAPREPGRAGGRHRARLQQSIDRDHRQRAERDARSRAGPSCPGVGVGRRARRPAVRRSRAPAPHLQPAAARPGAISPTYGRWSRKQRRCCAPRCRRR